MDDPTLRPGIDSHVHVWDAAHLNLSPDRRYTPTGEARVDELLRILKAHHIERAVLVQPSFLGTDNKYLLAALHARPEQFRGITVVDALTPVGELQELKALGVIGIRHNLVGQSPRALEVRPVQELTARAAGLDLWIEVHLEGADWEVALSALGDVPLMVDHFGRPSGPDCPGLRRLLDRDPERTCVKFSAPYRLPAEDLGPIARKWLDHLGPERCIWGSDWPWTQHEGRHGYSDCVNWLSEWTTPDERARMAAAAPRLLGFQN